MESSYGKKLFDIYRKEFRRKQLLFELMSVVYTFILIPLLKWLDGTDYSLLWRILSVTVSAMLIIQNIVLSRKLKMQLAAVSDAAAEKIGSELESCPRFRKNFWLTSEYFFSSEGLIVPYYEITRVRTSTTVASPSATYLIVSTRSFGKCYVRVGLGTLSENFYRTLSEKCPGAEMVYKVNYQNADIDEYFATVKAESILVIRKK